MLQDIYKFYNKSAKRQRRLKELAEKNNLPTIEDKTIEELENTIRETLKQGIYIF